ncbi:hypothetical protein CHU92_00215 [Flavobacterium cyanobacteriorum]|uniref:Uncharacterized protein n=1 Tax=Flavobacterium cyanobacteriorum TaxID=2022802 RepID=A0A256A870_9FLAO|nr:hypothetical protein [Flavobacterium cyanobacteriorum]OYQ49912.1 hypothetical protein CHU92_00215 [Flavobacterium cyanobacteriorum]
MFLQPGEQQYSHHNVNSGNTTVSPNVSICSGYSMALATTGGSSTQWWIGAPRCRYRLNLFCIAHGYNQLHGS